MYKQCDDCNGIFKIPSKLENYFEKHPNKVIYCPYCSGVWSHIYTKQYSKEIVMSKRGTII
jgi:predicted  nucleic acid-binding Zn-ribbon protein